MSDYLKMFENLKMDDIFYTTSIYFPTRPLKDQGKWLQKWMFIARDDTHPNRMCMNPFTSEDTFRPSYVQWISFYSFVKMRPQLEEPDGIIEYYERFPTDIKYSLRKRSTG